MSEDFLRRGIGLVGGTFDPVHHGHIALAQSAWEALPLARIAFVPAGNPWQKTDISSAEHRLAMLELALKDLPSDQFGVDPQELLRTGPSYSIDTLEHYRKKMGPSMPLVLILGMDQWCNLTTWHRWGDILKLSHIAVVNREMGNKTPQTLESLLKCHRVQPNELTLSSCGHITFFHDAHAQGQLYRDSQYFVSLSYSKSASQSRRLSLNRSVNLYTRPQALWSRCSTFLSLSS